MPYKPAPVNCRNCGRWIVKIDGRNNVIETNRKVIRRETRGVHPANAPDPFMFPPPDLFMFPGAQHTLTEVYVCACREGEYTKASTIASHPTDTL